MFRMQNLDHSTDDTVLTQNCEVTQHSVISNIHLLQPHWLHRAKNTTEQHVEHLKKNIPILYYIILLICDFFHQFLQYCGSKMCKIIHWNIHHISPEYCSNRWRMSSQNSIHVWPYYKYQHLIGSVGKKLCHTTVAEAITLYLIFVYKLS